MCMRVTCRTCGRPTFSGCGMHVEQVLGGVPMAQRCQCGAGATPLAGGSSLAVRIALIAGALLVAWMVFMATGA